MLKEAVGKLIASGEIAQIIDRYTKGHLEKPPQ